MKPLPLSMVPAVSLRSFICLSLSCCLGREFVTADVASPSFFGPLVISPSSIASGSASAGGSSSSLQRYPYRFTTAGLPFSFFFFLVIQCPTLP